MKNVLICLLLSLTVYADQNFRINGKNIKFYDESDLQITASEKCVRSNLKCTNFTFLDSISLKKITKKESAERNRIEVCKSQLNGQIFVGIDSFNNQNSFCYLEKKNLYMDIGTINFYANKNDNVVIKDLNISKKRRKVSTPGK